MLNIIKTPQTVIGTYIPMAVVDFRLKNGCDLCTRFIETCQFLDSPSERSVIVKEIFEFRLLERYAQLFLPPLEGRTLAGNSIRLVQFSTGDRRLTELAEIKRDANAVRNESPFYGWRMLHIYSELELSSASAFQLVHLQIAETAGEDSGPEYSNDEACNVCGFGRRQIGELQLNVSRIPANTDVCRTLGA